MLDLFQNIVSGIVIGLVMIKSTEILQSKKIKIGKFEFLIILINAFILTLTYNMMQNFLKVIFVFIDLILLNKLITKDFISKCMAISFIEYISALIAECLTGLFLSLLFYFISSDLTTSIKNTVALNAIIMIINYFLIFRFQVFYRKILSKMEDNNLAFLLITAIVILLCIGTLFFRVDSDNWVLNSQFIVNILMILAISIIGIVTLYERIKYEKVNKQYEDLAKFSEINATLVEDYSVLNHEYKNQLIIIKGMIGKKNKDVHEYIDSLISERKGITSQWIIELNNISFMGLRSFMNHKILEMRSKGLNANVVISKDCKNINLEALPSEVKKSIYSIVGVYLDNAMEAALLSEEKMVAINAYTTNKNQICLEIANTFSGEVELNKINTYGYSSKGTGRGTGLYIVNKLIKEHDCLESNTIIEHGYFIQKLIITQKK